jgi:hypothetical protein
MIEVKAELKICSVQPDPSEKSARIHTEVLNHEPSVVDMATISSTLSVSPVTARKVQLECIPFFSSTTVRFRGNMLTIVSHLDQSANPSVVLCVEFVVQPFYDNLSTMRCAILLAALVAFAAAWQQQGPAPSDMPMKLMIAVKQTNVEWLRDTLRKVSDPDSPSYGKLHVSTSAFHPYGRCIVSIAILEEGLSSGV